MEFKDILKQCREEMGVSRYKLAKDLGVNKQTISFWEEGVNEPKISYLCKLADYFEVSTDFLLGRQKW